MEHAPLAVLVRPDVPVRSAPQQPAWDDPALADWVRGEIAARPALVSSADVDALRLLLSQVAAGAAHVVQAGDCAEDPAECTRSYISRKRAVLDLLAGTMKLVTQLPVVRVGRVAGQFAKPRSQPTERVGGMELPVFRGHMVNSPEPDPAGRRADPMRMLSCYEAAQDAMRQLGWRTPPGRGSTGPPGRLADPPVWASHEALLLDYEYPMIRRDGTERDYLGSTHWPWIGYRTGAPDGAHVSLLSRVANPVACKVGPDTTVEGVLALCEELDPGRQPGRLTLIARMGAGRVTRTLPRLVTAVRNAGFPVIWLVDPMHANTVTTPDGPKTRFLDVMVAELREFLRAVRGAGGVAGGVHLETTPDPVSECVPNQACMEEVGTKYTSACDPRLNPEQAVAMVSEWQE